MTKKIRALVFVLIGMSFLAPTASANRVVDFLARCVGKKPAPSLEQQIADAQIDSWFAQAWLDMYERSFVEQRKSIKKDFLQQDIEISRGVIEEFRQAFPENGAIKVNGVDVGAVVVKIKNQFDTVTADEFVDVEGYVTVMFNIVSFQSFWNAHKTNAERMKDLEFSEIGRFSAVNRIEGVFLPSWRNLGFAEINDLTGLPVYPVGMTRQQSVVDGFTYSPEMFFEHDIAHGITLSEKFNQLKATAEVVRNGLKFHRVLVAARAAAKNKRQKVLVDAIWFYVYHELGDHFDDYARIKAQFMSGLSQSELKQRLANKNDLGQAFRAAPTQEEIVETSKLIAHAM